MTNNYGGKEKEKREKNKDQKEDKKSYRQKLGMRRERAKRKPRPRPTNPKLGQRGIYGDDEKKKRRQRKGWTKDNQSQHASRPQILRKEKKGGEATRSPKWRWRPRDFTTRRTQEVGVVVRSFMVMCLLTSCRGGGGDSRHPPSSWPKNATMVVGCPGCVESVLGMKVSCLPPISSNPSLKADLHCHSTTAMHSTTTEKFTWSLLFILYISFLSLFTINSCIVSPLLTFLQLLWYVQYTILI